VLDEDLTNQNVIAEVTYSVALLACFIPSA
jgi:hypothetical protein